MKVTHGVTKDNTILQNEEVRPIGAPGSTLEANAVEAARTALKTKNNSSIATLKAQMHLHHQTLKELVDVASRSSICYRSQRTKLRNFLDQSKLK